MAVQTTGSLTAEMKTWYDRVLLKAARERLIHNKWSQKRPIPRGEGKTVNWRRFELLTVPSASLVEGVTPPGSDLSITSVEATPTQEGDYVTLSDLLTWTAIDPVMTETVSILGYQAGEKLDDMTRDVLVAGTTVRYAGAATSRVTVAAADKINGIELRKMRRTLRLNKAQPAEGGFFPLIVSPNTFYDLQSMDEWVSRAENSRPGELDTGQVGEIYGFRVYESQKAKVFSGAGASSIDVHASVAIGKDFYGTTSIEGHAMETIMKPLGSAGTADPLNQRATAGWKATHVAKILNESFGARLEHAVTG